MKSISFTQFLLPAGEVRETETDVPEHVYDKAQDILSAGYRFEIEILRNGRVHATISDVDGDAAQVLSVNGPPLVKAIINLIMDFEIPEGR